MIEEVLSIDEIQGNSLVGFNKPFQHFLAFEIVDSTDVRNFIRSTPITSVREASDFKTLRRQLIQVSAAANIVATVTNMMISAAGLRKLGFNPELLGDSSFSNGMAANS
jgi:hypothetical protein